MALIGAIGRLFRHGALPERIPALRERVERVRERAGRLGERLQAALGERRDRPCGEPPPPGAAPEPGEGAPRAREGSGSAPAGGRGSGAAREARSGPAAEALFYGALTISTALRLHPDAASVLGRHRLAGCQSCVLADDETLEEGARIHAVDLEPLLRDLNALPG